MSQIELANAQGVDCEPLTPKQAGEKYPIMRTDDLVGAVWLPGDGKANPADITQALARGARTGGVRIFEKTRVTAVDTKDFVVLKKTIYVYDQGKESVTIVFKDDKVLSKVSTLSE